MTDRVHQEFTVPDEFDDARADAALARLTGLSRTVVGKLLRAGEATADGSVLAKSDKVAAGSVVRLLLPEERDLAEITPEVVAGFEVVHCDDDIVVVDKPAGVAAHPSPGWKGPTVVSALAGVGVSVSTSGAAERQGIVHRLDVGTSGLMVVARTERAYTALKRAFKERTVEKVYHTVVQSLPDPLEGTIDAPIGRHPGYEWRFAVVDGGRDSVTHYETLEAFGRATLVEVHLETGRTHQIRVHFSALHHPCCGDLTYGADPALSAGLGLTRQWLHARRLGFVHPATGENVTFESPYPPDLDYALETLRDGGP
ncbi:RluA family pseudouridine synthase [Kocuria soli]|uniref:Pseudouridine synthase n=1 Tax=Kocuria soli TaxID=2485125 RepID=A0A3N4A5J7_9MICC|nr:RluA family pseudouridine synthase [Kocuria soli]ROZ63984.1 RluA family pseudouridine synthase [Kocuria soli]